MINKICKLYANTLVLDGIISEDDREIHEYGMAALLINMINYGLWLAFALLSNTIVETGIFLFSYSILRNIIGGWHASTPIRCTICGAVMWACMISVYKTVVINDKALLIVTLFLVLCLIHIIQKQNLSSTRTRVGYFCLFSLITVTFLFFCLEIPYGSLILLSLFSNILMNIFSLKTWQLYSIGNTDNEYKKLKE